MLFQVQKLHISTRLVMAKPFQALRPIMTLALSLAGVWGGPTPAWAEVHPFTLDAPQAKQVYLAGEMTNWDAAKKPMKRDDKGIWHLDVDLGKGQWLYKFVVDGQWMADPVGQQNDADGQGGRHSFVFIGDGAWKENSETPHGQVKTIMLPSQAWGKSMKLNVYLPPGYKQGQTYPVLLLLHGANMDADQWLKTGMVHHYMDNLIAKKTIQPFVIIMPSSENINYTGKSEKFITEEIPVWLNQHYGLKPEPKSFAVAGMSMGGFGAFHLPQAHPKQFGFGFALSGYYPEATIQRVAEGQPLESKLMMLCGSEDSLVNNNRKLAAVLQKRGIKFYYRENAGAHTFQYWSNHIVEMLEATNRFFSGEAIAHNETALSLPTEKATEPVFTPIVGEEIKWTPEMKPRMLGLWRGEWIIMPGGIKGGYEEKVTRIDDNHNEGTYSVLDAGSDTKHDEPFSVRTGLKNGRPYFVHPQDKSDVETIISIKDQTLWRQWRMKINGLDILTRVEKVQDED